MYINKCYQLNHNLIYSYETYAMVIHVTNLFYDTRPANGPRPCGTASAGSTERPRAKMATMDGRAKRQWRRWKWWRQGPAEHINVVDSSYNML